MGRIVDIRGLRYGQIFDWNVQHRSLDKNSLVDIKLIRFEDYIKELFKKYFGVKFGLMLNKLTIEYKNKELYIKLYIYDGQLEDIYFNNSKIRKRVRFYNSSVLDLIVKSKLAVFEKLIQKFAAIYLDKKVKIEFYSCSNHDLESYFIANYISIRLNQGYSVNEVITGVQRSLKNWLKVKQSKLIGYKIDCSGRWSRNQRASFKTVKEGSIPFSKIFSVIDYSYSTAFLKYGTCGIKVWLYKEPNFNQKNIKIIL